MDRISISENRYRELLKYEDYFYGNHKESIKSICDELESMINKGDEDDPTGNDWGVWEPIYDKVFSSNESISICKRVKRLVPDFTWFDPDTTYKEDVCAFFWALNEYIYEHS